MSQCLIDTKVGILNPVNAIPFLCTNDGAIEILFFLCYEIERRKVRVVAAERNSVKLFSCSGCETRVLNGRLGARRAVLQG